MGPTPIYGAGAEKPVQKADFAMKQTNICRLSGDINDSVCGCAISICNLCDVKIKQFKTASWVLF